jgi:branched-chain amino acid transport system substrate-binding protein
MGKSMKNKFLVLAVVLTLVTSLVIAGCVPAPPPVTPPPVTPPPVEPVEPLVIGTSMGRTGWMAVVEVDLGDMMIIYADKVNKEGGINGRPVEFIIYDNESTTELAVTQTTKLIEEDEALIVISQLWSGPTWAQYEIIKDTGVPFIIMVGGPQPDEVFIPGENMFNNHPSYDFFAEATLRYFKEDLGLTRVAFLATSDESGEEDLEWGLEHAEKLGLEVVLVERCDPEAMDVTAQLTRIKAANPEALQLAGSGVVVGPMFKGIKLLGLDIPISTANGMTNPEGTELMKGYEPEVLVMPVMPPQAGAIPGILPADDPIMIVIDEMWDLWEEYYGETRGTKADLCFGWSWFGWDVMEIAVEGLRQAGPLPDDLAEARETVRSAMENKIIGFETEWGTRTYSPTDKCGLEKFCPALMTMVDGELILLKQL